MTKTKNYYDHISRYDGKIFDFQNTINEIVYNQEITNELLRRINSPQTLRIVDLGCGNACLLRFLLQYCKSKHEYFGVDISGAVIKSNSLKYSKINFCREDVLKTSFKDNYFDVVVSTMVVEHLRDDQKFVKEVRRIVRQGGFFLISSVMKKERAWYYLKDSHGNSVLTLDHVKEYTSEQEFRELLTKNKFKIVKIKITSLSFPVIDILLRRFMNLIPKFLLDKSIFNRIINEVRKIKIPIKGFFAIEAFCIKE